MQVRNDIKEFINTIPNKATIVAATKYVTPVEMISLLENGINNFGENRVDAFLSKYEILKDNKNIVWHFIGHLQRNKANKIIDKIDFLHSLDSLELARLINEKRIEPLNVFVEVSVNLEETKSGIPMELCKDFISEIIKLPNINVVGLMMMSVKASEHSSLEQQFKKLKDLRDSLEQQLDIKLPYLSMGMSDDYKEALDNGATHIRLGRILFEGYQPY